MKVFMHFSKSQQSYFCSIAMLKIPVDCGSWARQCSGGWAGNADITLLCHQCSFWGTCRENINKNVWVTPSKNRAGIEGVEIPYFWILFDLMSLTYWTEDNDTAAVTRTIISSSVSLSVCQSDLPLSWGDWRERVQRTGDTVTMIWWVTSARSASQWVLSSHWADISRRSALCSASAVSFKSVQATMAQTDFHK